MHPTSPSPHRTIISQNHSDFHFSQENHIDTPHHHMGDHQIWSKPQVQVPIRQKVVSFPESPTAANTPTHQNREVGIVSLNQTWQK